MLLLEGVSCKYDSFLRIHETSHHALRSPRSLYRSNLFKSKPREQIKRIRFCCPSNRFRHVPLLANIDKTSTFHTKIKILRERKRKWPVFLTGRGGGGGVKPNDSKKVYFSQFILDPRLQPWIDLS